MKIAKLALPLLILALILSACGTDTSAATNEADILNAVYTAAALTLSAETAASTPTPTLKPASTATPFASATLISTSAAAQPYSVPAAVVNASSSCDNSAFISDITVSDGTVFAPGEAFTKTWSFQNTGSCSWTTSYSIVFVSGNTLSGSATALSASASSGGQINVSIEMVAPTTTGTYTGYWKLQNAAGTSFGQSVYVQIVVSDDAATITPTPTATSEASEATSMPTSTSAPTSTSTPISVPTEVPTSTPEPATSTPVPTDTSTETTTT